MIRLEMKSYSMVLIEKQPKVSALSSGKIHKCEYLTGEDIVPSNQQQIIEQARFTYSPLGKAFEKQIKTIENQGKKQSEFKIEDNLKQLKNMLMMLKILHLSQNKKKYLMNL